MARSGEAPGVDVSIVIAAPPGRVLKAFFEAEALGAWWQVSHSVTSPRTLGPYVVEWAPTLDRDELLGRLGGVLRGTVVEFTPDEGFLLADAFWLPPDGDPIGPTAIAVTVKSEDGKTRLRVTQTGFENGDRWRRYSEQMGAGWRRALHALKQLLEK
jgi:uncharacterized protein YndB with AHSA1/START domain